MSTSSGGLKALLVGALLGSAFTAAAIVAVSHEYFQPSGKFSAGAMDADLHRASEILRDGADPQMEKAVEDLAKLEQPERLKRLNALYRENGLSAQPMSAGAYASRFAAKHPDQHDLGMDLVRVAYSVSVQHDADALEYIFRSRAPVCVMLLKRPAYCALPSPAP